MALDIRKKISLDFLGEEYKDSYLEFKTITVRQFKDYQVTIKGVDDDGVKAIDILVEILKNQLVGGEIKGEKFDKANIEELDIGTISKVFEILTGGQDPK